MNTRQAYTTICTALLLLGHSATGSIGVISLEELTRKADLIVHGTVASIENVKSERKMNPGNVPIPIAVIRFTPEKLLKGAATEPIIVKAIENMEDSPNFEQDQEAFLFLKQNADDSSFSVFGLTQGKFDVVEGLVVREGISVAVFTEMVEKLVRIQNTD